MEPSAEVHAEDPWHAPMRWLVTAAALAVLLVGRSIPLPGLDREVSSALGVGAGALLGSGLWLLVLARAGRALARAEGMAADRLVVLLYLLASAGVAWKTATALAAVRLGPAPLVLDPGLAWILLVVATLTAGNAVLWKLADWVSRGGLGSGPLVLFALTAAPVAFRTAFLQGEAIGDGGAPVLAVFLVPLAVTVVVLGLAGAWPRWPLELRPGFALRSPIDLLALPSAVAAAIVPLHAPIAPLEGGSGLISALPAFGGLLAGVAAALWLSGRGVARPLVLLLAPVPLSCTALGLAGGWAASGALERALAPGPFDGQLDAVVEITASPAEGAEADAPVIRRRLEALGVDAELTGAPPRLRVELRGVADAAAVMDAVLPRRALSFHEVYDDGVPPGAPVDTLRECPDCPRLAVAPAMLDASHVADASVAWSDYGGPVVLLVFTPEGADLFGRETARLVGRRFAIVLDGEVESAPTIREAILGGRAQIEMGYGAADPHRDALALVAALNSEPLGGTWQVASVDALP